MGLQNGAAKGNFHANLRAQGLVIWGDDFEGHSLEFRFGPTTFFP